MTGRAPDVTDRETKRRVLKFSRCGVAGKLEDVDYDELDLRPSELAIKIKEKRGAYAVPKVPHS